MPLIFPKQSIQTLLILFSLLCSSISAFAANNTWLRLQTPRFGIISQLDEKGTKLWAKEFDKFITALQQLYNAEDKSLLPLTIVIFKNKKEFEPYRNLTESGQGKNVVGLFVNRDNFSIIALPGLRGYQETRHTIFHEAVHWFLNSQNYDFPLWLEEGLAELFSTFDVKHKKGQWGLPIRSYANYLNIKNLQPTREFLYATQDEALNKLDTYYPQAWAMAHYFMFGNRGKNRSKFYDFISYLDKKTSEEAFQSAFGITFEEFDRDLQFYLLKGLFYISEVELTDANYEMDAGPASDDMVQFALGRLAVSGGNTDLGIKHAQAVISNSPSRPEGYELLAISLEKTENKSKLYEALDKAISLDSNDSQIYFMKASMLMEDKWETGLTSGGPLEKEVARQIADLFKKSILLHLKKKYAFEGFSLALMNANSYGEDDRKILELGRDLYPKEGSILAGLAALDRMDGDINSFNQKLEESYGDSMRMSANLKKILQTMQQNAYGDWLFDQLQPLMDTEKFDDAEAVLRQQNSLPFISTDMQSVIEQIGALLYTSKQLHNADVAMSAGRIDDAAAILSAIEKDGKVPREGKSIARRIMSEIEKIRKHLD